MLEDRPEEEAENTKEARASAWDTEAREAWMAGDFTRSRQIFEKVLDLWRGKANSIFALIHVTQAMRFETGYDPAVARPLLEEALKLADHMGNAGAIAAAQVNLAAVTLEQGDYAASLSLAQQLVSKSLHFTELPLWAMLSHAGLALIGLGLHEDGLRLYAAGTALRERLGIEIEPPILRQHHEQMTERILAVARSSLGPERQASAEREGRDLPAERAVELAVSMAIPGQVKNSATTAHGEEGIAS